MLQSPKFPGFAKHRLEYPIGFSEQSRDADHALVDGDPKAKGQEAWTAYDPTVARDPVAHIVLVTFGFGE